MIISNTDVCYILGYNQKINLYRHTLPTYGISVRREGLKRAVSVVLEQMQRKKDRDKVVMSQLKKKLLKYVKAAYRRSRASPELG